MIVFKAECGHTVRARDEDAGGVVRCSYCGRNVSVPESDGGSLNFLLEEIEQAATPAKEGRRKLFRRRPRVVAPRKERPFDPFGVILRLCYFSVLLAVVIIVANKFVIPMLKNDEERARRMTGDSTSKSTEDASTQRPSARKRDALGLITEENLTGLYVASVPKGAEVFVVEQSRAPARGRINRLAGTSFQTDGFLSRITDGKYVVEVAFAWNDPNLSDPSLPSYRDYLEFRRSIERTSDAQRRQLTEDYFVPDEATDVFVAESEERLFFVRQYRGVVVTLGRSKGVRAFFLPRLGKGGGRPFSIEPLLLGYTRDDRAYAFDAGHVKNELAYYGVPEAEQRFVIDALTRVGAIPYASSDGRIRMFKIDIHDGAFTSRVLRETLP